MTRRSDDLLTLWHADENDVCSPDELLARVARTAPIARRRRMVLAAAAVAVVVGVVATVVALRPEHPSTHLGLGRTVASTPTPTPTASATSRPTPTASPTPAASPTAPAVSTRTHLVDLGHGHTSVPARWFAAPYLGSFASVYYPILFFGTERFVGPCATSTTGRKPPVCTTKNWFPPKTVPPPDGLVLMWAFTEYPVQTGDGLEHLSGRRTTIDHRPAKLYSGTPTASCPSGTDSEIDAHVRMSPTKNPGVRYDMIACLGAQVSAVDRQAVYAMVQSLRITG